PDEADAEQNDQRQGNCGDPLPATVRLRLEPEHDLSRSFGHHDAAKRVVRLPDLRLVAVDAADPAGVPGVGEDEEAGCPTVEVDVNLVGPMRSDRCRTGGSWRLWGGVGFIGALVEKCNMEDVCDVQLGDDSVFGFLRHYFIDQERSGHDREVLKQ